MVEPDRQVDLDRVAREERAVVAAEAVKRQAETDRRQAQGRIEKNR